MNISADISEQDNNVLSIKDNDPRGPEFDKVVRKAKQIRDNLIPVATRVENCNLRICYQYLKTMAKNKVNDRIRGNLKKMNKKFGDFLEDIMSYKEAGKKTKICSIVDDIESLLDVLSGPKMTEKQYHEAVKKIEDKLAGGKKKQ